MMHAAIGGHKDLVDSVLFSSQRAQTVGFYLGFNAAAKFGHKNLVDFFIEKLGTSDIYNHTGLYWAVKGGQKDIADFFIGRIVYPQNKKKALDMALGYAMDSGNSVLVDFINGTLRNNIGQYTAGDSVSAVLNYDEDF